MIILVVILLVGVIIEAGIIALLAIALHGKVTDLDKVKSAIDQADQELTQER